MIEHHSFAWCFIIWCYFLFVNTIFVEVLSAPTAIKTGNERQSGEPVWSHGESYAVAYATGEGAVLETDSWTNVDNHGGLQVNQVTSDGSVIGYEVAGQTNCSQESYAYASGAWFANAIAWGLCNSTVLLDQPVSNTGYGKDVEKVIASDAQQN